MGNALFANVLMELTTRTIRIQSCGYGKNTKNSTKPSWSTSRLHQASEVQRYAFFLWQPTTKKRDSDLLSHSYSRSEPAVDRQASKNTGYPVQGIRLSSYGVSVDRSCMQTERSSYKRRSLPVPEAVAIARRQDFRHAKNDFDSLLSG